MKTSFLLIVLNSLLLANDASFVNLKKYDFSIKQDIRYATENNFVKQKVYPSADCFLRKKVAHALSRVQNSLKMLDVRLKVYDCYRPLSVQKKFWEIMPDDRYVSDPKKGSKHNRGAAVDLTLVDKNGDEVEMPTAYDDFTEKAHRDYQGGTKLSLRNRKLLEDAMKKEGFTGIPTEWWHFDYKGWEQYPIEDISFDKLSN